MEYTSLVYCGFRTEAHRPAAPFHFLGSGRRRATPFRLQVPILNFGGEGEIRTRGGVSPTHAFQACPLDHSGTSPFFIYKTNTLVRRPEYFQILFDSLFPIQVNIRPSSTNMRHNTIFFKYDSDLLLMPPSPNIIPKNSAKSVEDFGILTFLR